MEDCSRHSRQLLAEFKQICYQFGIALIPPVIRIAPLRSAWGQWSPQPRMITIAQTLITDHPWHAVIEVLKHEMAHQMVSELHGSDEQHGNLFRSCARQLGMSAWAMRANFEINTKIYSSELASLTSSDTPALRKVRKLLALATSNEEHESSLALQKARELTLKHNLKSVGKDDDECVMHVINTKRQRIRSEQLAICGLLTSHFPVYVILGNTYDARAGVAQRTIELYGKPTDLKTAEYVYHYLLNQMRLHWQAVKNRPDYRHNKCQRSYYRGLIAGFDAKLTANKTRPQEHAVIVHLQAQAKCYADQRCPKTQKTNSKAGYRSRQGYADGFTAGEQLELRKGVANNGQTFLLTS
ncbi:MAG: DUF2786 domain-containing protein [Pseudomonadota bacterium]|nr:DUF2786 domain-containing protein [Pseudomonadota bacterium]